MANMKEKIKKNTLNLLERYPRVAFIHVPKCAGVSVYSSIYAALYPSFFKATPLTEYIDLNASKKCSDLLDIDMMRAREVVLVNHLDNPFKRFVTGHCHANPKVVAEYCDRWKFVTVLRDPIDRFISEYVYNRFKKSDWVKIDSDIEQYLESDAAKIKALTIAKYFSGGEASNLLQTPKEVVFEGAISNLSKFESVGFVDDLENWNMRLSKRLGKKIPYESRNASPNNEMFEKIKNSPVLYREISKICALDLEIYNECRERFSQ